MIVTCGRCNKRYSVSDDKLLARSAKIRCRNCEYVISVPSSGQAHQPNPGAAAVLWGKSDPAQPPAGLSGEWFLALHGKQVGPVPGAELTARCRSGEVTANTYLWRAEMTDWQLAAQIPEIQSVLALGSAARAPAESAAPTPDIASSAANGQDPFNVADVDPARFHAAGETTHALIGRSGIRSQNPLWKMVAAGMAVLSAPACLLYLLSELRVIPFSPVRVDDSGPEMHQSVFSKSGASALGNLLLGRGRNAARPTGKAIKTVESTKAKPVVTAELRADLAPVYGDSAHTDIGPRIRQGTEEKGQDATEGGLNEREVAKVVGRAQTAFQFCIEQELKKNPSFRGGKIFISASVGSSGIVKSAEISRREIESSPLGDCLKGKARRMVFPSFSGEDSEVQIPLILGTAM